MVEETANFIIEVMFFSFLSSLFLGMLAIADHLEEERGIKNNMLSSGTLISDKND